MSEQEKKSTVNAGPSMVVIEQASEIEHKQPYRPTELGTPDSELHHKRSKAPAVPAMADELKVSEESNNDNETLKDKTESEPLSSEIYKQTVVKKISSIPHKRPSSTEIIALESVKISTNPMPSIAPVAPTIDDEKSQNKIVKEKKSDEDSITDEVAELPAADTATVHSEWRKNERNGGDEEKCTVRENPGQLDLCLKAAPLEQKQMKDMACSSNIIKKKEISWNDKDYLSRVELKEFSNQSQIWLLERKASVGPCKSRTAYQEPSGISISVPKKSTKSLKEDAQKTQSGINITFSKKCIAIKSRSEMVRKGAKRSEDETRAVKVDPDVPYIKMLGALKSKIEIVRSKIRNVINS